MDEIFGKPREGFHEARTYGDLARNDIIGTALLAILISKKYDINIIKSFGGLFIAGEALHLIFGVKTPVTNQINKISKKDRGTFLT